MQLTTGPWEKLFVDLPKKTGRFTWSDYCSTMAPTSTLEAARATTPVMKVSTRGHLEVLDLLKERGADVVAKDRDGDSALNFASRGLQSLVVPGLLESGLAFTETSFCSWTPLHRYALGPLTEISMILSDFN